MRKKLVIFITGEKGGVGKSVLSRVFAEWLRIAQSDPVHQMFGKSVGILDADGKNLSLTKYFGKGEENDPLHNVGWFDLDTDSEADNVLNCLSLDADVLLFDVPGGGSMVRLARQIPYAHAMHLLLTGEPIDAPTALAWGLISEVVAPHELRARAEALATRIAANAPLALAAIKRTVIDSHTESWNDAFTREAQESAKVMMTRDAREGPRAFKEKRTPDFRGE